MNTLLASSPTLTMRTYVTCTALALPKLLIHTGLGTSIKNFAAYNGAAEGQSREDAQASQTAENVKKWAGLIGAGLCFGIMIYLLSVARRAVDDLDDEDEDEYDDELYDDDGEVLLSSDDEDDHRDGADGFDHGPGVDMRERAGPSTLGFRNGYAPRRVFARGALPSEHASPARYAWAPRTPTSSYESVAAPARTTAGSRSATAARVAITRSISPTRLRDGGARREHAIRVAVASRGGGRGGGGGTGCSQSKVVAHDCESGGERRYE